jgi:hypothetical protein
VLLGDEEGQRVGPDGGEVAGDKGSPLDLQIGDPVGLVDVLQHILEPLESRARTPAEGDHLEDAVVKTGNDDAAWKLLDLLDIP